MKKRKSNKKDKFNLAILLSFFSGLLILLLFLIMEIFNQYPEIIKIEPKIDFIKKEINLEVIEEKAVARICYQKQCYFLGEHGYIFNKNNKSQENLIEIVSFLPIDKNSILDNQITNLLTKIFEYSHHKNLYLKKIEILNNKDLKIYTNHFSFLMDPRIDINHQIKKLDYFLENYSKPFSEIDLRINRKIYFK
jgi:hypothetical protein